MRMFRPAAAAFFVLALSSIDPFPEPAAGACPEGGIDGRFHSVEEVRIDGLPAGDEGTPLSTDEPFISRDDRFLFFNSGENENNKDLHFAERRDGRWVYRGPLTAVGAEINNRREVQGNPTMSRANEFLYVDSGTESMIRRGTFDRAAGTITGLEDLGGVPGKDVRLLSQRASVNMGVELSADGELLLIDRAHWNLRLWWASRLTGSDIRWVPRAPAGFRFDEGETKRVLSAVNTEDLEYAPSLSEDTLEMFFTRLGADDLAKGTIRSRILSTRRPDRSAAFEAPMIVSAFGCDDFVEAPALAAGGKELYIHKRIGSKNRLFRARRE